MDKQSHPFDLSQDVTMAADGLELMVDNQTLFCTPAPLAASTVNRASNRNQVPLDTKGSFLDDMSRLSLQSASGLPHDGAPARDSGPDLIQFSGATNMGSDTENNKSDSQTDVSSRSSMGLIPSEMLSDCELIASDLDTGADMSQGVLPMGAPKADPAKESSHREQESAHREHASSHSAFKEKTGDSCEWSDSSKQDSKQDSKDLPWGLSHLETVKKRPQPLDTNTEGIPARTAVRGALSLFTRHLLDNVQEGEELDQSVHNVEFGDEDLRQLDVDFSDLEEDPLGGARESGDEDFDFDEPLLGLPMRERAERGEDEGHGSPEVQEKTLQAELAEAECRIGEGQESEDECGGGNQTTSSSNDFGGLDSRYCRKTTMPFAGDGEDAEIATSRTSVVSTSQQRGAAEGENLLTKLRRQFMSGDGSENEIDTDDELETAKKCLAMAARKRGQGADEEKFDRSKLPLPVGLEDARQPSISNQSNQQSEQDEPPRFSFTTRQSAEGDAAYSPVPWSGGGGGDGSSGGDSDGGGRSVGPQTHRLPFRYVSGAAEKQDPSSSTSTRNTSMAASAEDPPGLCPEFFLPSACCAHQDSRVISPHTLEGSTFNVEDIFHSKTETPSDVPPDKQQEEEVRLDASGFSTEDAPQNPFEGRFAGSFGSFELGAADSTFGETAERSAEESNSSQNTSTGKASSSLFTPKLQPGSGVSGSYSGPPGKGSGSFDGPFRKPRAPAPSKKKIDRKEASVSKSNESWKNATFQDQSDDELAQELRDLGIHVGDDDFMASEDAKALLDADEKQFEEENKFRMHRQLSLAAEGLAWDDSHFSGILEGEENPEQEISIGSYMASRTEALGTLGGDPNIPRPEFGKPVHSPPHRPYPVRLIAPPSTASSLLLLDSRTEGVGNEDGDRTMTADSASLQGDKFGSPKRSPTSRASRQETEEVGSKTKPGFGTTADATLRAELSSLLLDLTNNSIGDLSLDDGLSMSTVFDFIKNHSYSKSSDFAKAIVQFSQNKKQCQVSKSIEEESKQMEQSREDTRREDKQKQGVSKTAADESCTKSAGNSSSSQSTPQSTASKSLPRLNPSVLKSPQGSKLPVPLGTQSAAVVEKRVSSRSTGSSMKPLSKSTKSQSVSQIPSHPQLKDETVKCSWDDSFIAKHQNMKHHNVRQDVKQHDISKNRGDLPKTDSSKLFHSQKKSRATRESSRLDALPSTQDVMGKGKIGLTSGKHSSDRSSGQANADSQMKSSTGISETSGRKNTDMSMNQEQNNSKLTYYDNLSHEPSKKLRKSKTLATETNKHQPDFPTNIPPSAHKENPVTKETVKENTTSSISTHFSTGYHQEYWGGASQNIPSHVQMQSPPQKLSVASKKAAPQTQELCSPTYHDTASSNQSSPRGTRQDHHVPDGMDSATSASAGIGIRLGAECEQAMGGNLMKSSKFDAGKVSQDLLSQGTNSASQKLFSPQAAPQREPKPTLLTGASLLNTDFAQRYLVPKVTNQTIQEQAEQLGYNCIAPHDAIRAPGYAQPAHSHIVSQVPQPPNATLHTMDESAMSVYYELNEDPHQTTLQGGEMSMGSFWGKSPLFQSTPALEVGKVAALSVMGSRLDERELTTPGTNMVTPRVQRQLIDMQRSVDFPEFCCLGVSQKITLPVSNRTAFGVVCRFSLVRLVHNGKVVRVDQQSPFELKPKISISAGEAETLPVLFVPKQAGEYICQVEVFAQSMNPTLEPVSIITQLRAVAEVPHIMICPSADVVHLGEVMWGGCVSKVIKLRNVKKASLPVRLSIWSASSVWHCFSFDKTDNMSEVSIISLSSRPESLGRNVTTVILPGCDSPDSAKTIEICIYCKPPVKELNRALAERPAENIEVKINVEVDTPVQFLPPLASLLMQATVGMPRLLIPPSHMSMAFKTEMNRNIQDSIMLTNAGNISMGLALSVTTFPQCFKVSPSRLTIKPGASAEVTVTFSPLETDVYHYQSLLLLDLEPEGPSYEIAMEAVVHRPSALRPTPLNILINKSCLSFSGVPLNQAKTLTVRLLNKDVSKAEHACVEFKQSSDCFKLVSASGEWQQKCELAIEPQQKATLTVIFCPTAVRGYSGKLSIHKSDGHSTKYSVPLSGYGGRSVITLSGACLTNSGQQWLELGSLSVGHNIMREVVLTNSGVRAAFVRATAFYDMPCRQPVPPGRVAVEPNNFVLATGCSMKVMVAISPSLREVDLVRERKEVVAVVRFQHGDEIMRQKYQRACNREGVRDQHTWQAAFRQHFTNETQDSITLEGHTIPDSPDDSSAFFHHLSSQHVALLAEPPADREASAMSVSTLLHSATHSHTPLLPTREKSCKVLGGQGPKRDDNQCQFLIPSKPDPDEEKWTVRPDFLSLSVGDKNSGIVQLINFSRQSLRFEITWPPSSVIPEPQKGEVRPRSSSSIEVWLHTAWQKRLTELPWRGEIVISCNGQEKNVRVHIQNTIQPSLLALSSPHSSPVSVSSVSVHSPKDKTLVGANRSVQLATANVHFPNAKMNGVHESVLELTNTSTEPVHWKISAFAPPYVKGADSSNTVQRVGYNVFTITQTSADLLPQETMKVPVKFCPKTKGTFNQHWEVEYQPVATGRLPKMDKLTTKISFTAEVTQVRSRESVSSRKPSWDTVDQDKTAHPSSRTPLQEKHPNTEHSTGGERVPTLQLMDQEVTFSSTKVGQVTQVRVELKNSYDHSVEMEAIAPKPPFRIKHINFKITKKRFLKYPVEFAPAAPGTYEDTMTFKAPNLAKTFTLHLKGIGL